MGVVTAASLADFGHTVECVDRDQRRTTQLNAGVVPFYESGLDELVQRHVASGQLKFSTDIGRAAARAAAVFLTVGTAEGRSGDVDVDAVLSAATSAAPHMRHGSVLVTKSTVPIGTGALIEDILARHAQPGAVIDVVANPEFLRAGSAVRDFARPERVVIGTRNERAAAYMRELFQSLYVVDTPVIETTIETAELIKYVSNAYLAVKLAFANEIAHLCDRVGADVHLVTTAMGLDRRIGVTYLRPGPGFGGPCLPRDVRALAAMGAARSARQHIVEAAIAANERQRFIILERIRRAINGMSPATIALLGLAYKPNTSEVRESPAIFICQRLATSGIAVRTFDPLALAHAKSALGSTDGVSYCADPYEAANGADLLAVMTEWNEFRSLDWRRLRGLMRQPRVFDARNMFDPTAIVAEGFTYSCLGRQIVASEPRTGE
jgi:UDPglucose 6-dehydrogenase